MSGRKPVIFKSIFLGDVFSEWLGNIMKEEMNKKLSKTKFIRIPSIIEQSNEVIELIRGEVNILLPHEVLMIIITSPLFFYMYQLIVKIFETNVVTLKFAGSTVNPSAWIASELEKLKVVLETVIYEIDHLANRNKVRFYFIVHPMIDLIQHLRASLGSDNIITHNDYMNNENIKKIIDNLIVHMFNINKYLFECDRVFKKLAEDHTNIDYTSFQVKYKKQLIDFKLMDDVLNAKSWMNGYINMRRWRMVSHDGLAPHTDIFEDRRRWVRQAYAKFGESDYSSSYINLHHLDFVPVEFFAEHPKNESTSGRKEITSAAKRCVSQQQNTHSKSVHERLSSSRSATTSVRAAPPKPTNQGASTSYAGHQSVRPKLRPRKPEPSREELLKMIEETKRKTILIRKAMEENERLELASNQAVRHVESPTVYSAEATVPSVAKQPASCSASTTAETAKEVDTNIMASRLPQWLVEKLKTPLETEQTINILGEPALPETREIIETSARRLEIKLPVPIDGPTPTPQIDISGSPERGAAKKLVQYATSSDEDI